MFERLHVLSLPIVYHFITLYSLHIAVHSIQLNYKEIALSEKLVKTISLWHLYPFSYINGAIKYQPKRFSNHLIALSHVLTPNYWNAFYVTKFHFSQLWTFHFFFIAYTKAFFAAQSGKKQIIINFILLKAKVFNSLFVEHFKIEEKPLKSLAI